MNSSDARLNRFIIRNNQIEGSFFGAWLMSFDNSTSIMNNFTITENTMMGVDYGMGFAIFLGIDNESGDSPTMNNSIIWNNDCNSFLGLLSSTSMTINYSDVSLSFENESSLGQSNINANPMFANPSDQDYSLTADSPCIDAGDPNLTDPDQTQSDIGAIFFNQNECIGDSGDINGDESVNVLDVILLVNMALGSLETDLNGDMNQDGGY